MYSVTPAPAPGREALRIVTFNGAADQVIGAGLALRTYARLLELGFRQMRMHVQPLLDHRGSTAEEAELLAASLFDDWKVAEPLPAMSGAGKGGKGSRRRNSGVGGSGGGDREAAGAYSARRVASEVRAQTPRGETTEAPPKARPEAAKPPPKAPPLPSESTKPPPPKAPPLPSESTKPPPPKAPPKPPKALLLPQEINANEEVGGAPALSSMPTPRAKCAECGRQFGSERGLARHRRESTKCSTRRESTKCSDLSKPAASQATSTE